MLSRRYALNKDYSDSIIFNTDYIGKGYGKGSSAEDNFAKRVRKQSGLLLDKTYSARAMYGMMDHIKKNHITGNVLFWMTGGPLNAKL